MIGDVSETLESVQKGIAERLTARTAYGEPIVRDGVTVIPVARVMLGYGAGGGVGEAKRSNGDSDAVAPVGGGGGGGGMVQPIGFIEITDGGAHWQPLEPPASEMALRALGIAVVLLPFGGKRFLFGRLLALVIGQAIAGRLSRPNLPPMESFRFGSNSD